MVTSMLSSSFMFLIRLYTTVNDYFSEYIHKPYIEYTRCTMENQVMSISKCDLNSISRRVLHIVPWYQVHIMNFYRFVCGTKWIIGINNLALEEFHVKSDNIVYDIEYYDKYIITRSLDIVNDVFGESLQRVESVPQGIVRKRHHDKVLYAGIEHVCDVTNFVNRYYKSFTQYKALSTMDMLTIAYMKGIIDYNLFYLLLQSLDNKDKMRYDFKLIMNDDLAEITFDLKEPFII